MPGRVDHVVNFDFPLNAVDYLHRTGRTARAGATGSITSLVARRDQVTVFRFQIPFTSNPIRRRHRQQYLPHRPARPGDTQVVQDAGVEVGIPALCGLNSGLTMLASQHIKTVQLAVPLPLHSVQLWPLANMQSIRLCYAQPSGLTGASAKRVGKRAPAPWTIEHHFVNISLSSASAGGRMEGALHRTLPLDISIDP